jgi:hypothetical protein
MRLESSSGPVDAGLFNYNRPRQDSVCNAFRVPVPVVPFLAHAVPVLSPFVPPQDIVGSGCPPDDSASCNFQIPLGLDLHRKTRGLVAGNPEQHSKRLSQLAETP